VHKLTELCRGLQVQRQLRLPWRPRHPRQPLMVHFSCKCQQQTRKWTLERCRTWREATSKNERGGMGIGGGIWRARARKSYAPCSFTPIADSRCIGAGGEPAAGSRQRAMSIASPIDASLTVRDARRFSSSLTVRNASQFRASTMPEQRVRGLRNALICHGPAVTNGECNMQL
jgi:hypothetical protein